jgi:hypothetical protein
MVFLGHLEKEASAGNAGPYTTRVEAAARSLSEEGFDIDFDMAWEVIKAYTNRNMVCNSETGRLERWLLIVILWLSGNGD